MPGRRRIQLTFKNAQTKGWHLILPLLASFALMIANERWQDKVEVFSQAVTKVMWPIQRTADLPFRLFEKLEIFFDERLELASENNALKQKHIYLEAQVQKLRALEAENYELRELLQSAGREKESFSEGRIIKADVDPFSQQILLNKGKQHAIEVGQPVIDSHGLVGVVLAVTQNSSRVLLLTDPSFAVPVQSVRSGERAIATGSGPGGELRLNYVPHTADFIEGDQLVTSGLGGRFPAGFPVGIITSIHNDPSTRFTLIAATPTAKLGQLRHVLFVKHHPAISEGLKPAMAEQDPSCLKLGAQASGSADAKPSPNESKLNSSTTPHSAEE